MDKKVLFEALNTDLVSSVNWYIVPKTKMKKACKYISGDIGD